MSTPSERIKLISEIATRLGDEGWSLIDLTLEQFGLPTSDSWGGQAEDYVIAMTSRADVRILEALAHHLDIDLLDERPGVEPDFWAPGHFRLFASHLSSQCDYATALKASLEKFQISTFVAHKDITPTKQWEDEIQLALATADALVALLHPTFHSSSWTDQEVGFVIGRGRLAVAVRLGEDPYGFIGRLQAFSGVGKPTDDLAQEIFNAFVKNKQTKRRMAEALISRFEDSRSYKGAARNIELLRQIDYWDPVIRKRIENAAKNNSQIAHAFGVPERARQLVQQWDPTPTFPEVELEDIPFE